MRELKVGIFNCSLDKDYSLSYWRMGYGMEHWHAKNDSQAKNNYIKHFWRPYLWL